MHRRIALPIVATLALACLLSLPGRSSAQFAWGFPGDWTMPGRNIGFGAEGFTSRPSVWNLYDGLNGQYLPSNSNSAPSTSYYAAPAYSVYSAPLYAPSYGYYAAPTYYYTPSYGYSGPFYRILGR